jgi:hypothetical protein
MDWTVMNSTCIGEGPRPEYIHVHEGKYTKNPLEEYNNRKRLLYNMDNKTKLQMSKCNFALPHTCGNNIGQMGLKVYEQNKNFYMAALYGQA